VHCLGLYGILTINYICIFAWYFESDQNHRLLSFIPLTKFATIVFIFINLLGYLAIIAHLRAAFSDPGVIDATIKPPTVMPSEEVKGCMK